MVALILFVFFFFPAEVGIRVLVRSRGLGDVYKRQGVQDVAPALVLVHGRDLGLERVLRAGTSCCRHSHCLFYTSDAADELLRVVVGGRCINTQTQSPTPTSNLRYASSHPFTVALRP